MTEREEANQAPQAVLIVPIGFLLFSLFSLRLGGENRLWFLSSLVLTLIQQLTQCSLEHENSSLFATLQFFVEIT